FSRLIPPLDRTRAGCSPTIPFTPMRPSIDLRTVVAGADQLSRPVRLLFPPVARSRRRGPGLSRPLQPIGLVCTSPVLRIRRTSTGSTLDVPRYRAILQPPALSHLF